jgi:hypothetical protein
MGNRRTPCPDPDSFIWVNSADGGYWRRKRGTLKKAIVNESLQKNAALTKPVNDASRRIIAKLHPYLSRLAKGRAYSKIGGRLKKAFNVKDRMDYCFLKGLDLQPKYPLDRLLKPLLSITIKEEFVEVSIPIYEHNLEHTGGLVTHYFFELILLQGDASVEHDLRVDSDTSAVYSIGSVGKDCVLSVHPTKQLWMVLLKLNTIETPTVNVVEMAASPSNYGMKVIAVG